MIATETQWREEVVSNGPEKREGMSLVTTDIQLLQPNYHASWKETINILHKNLKSKENKRKTKDKRNGKEMR